MRSQKCGKLIAIDGGEGSGKSSLVDFLKSELSSSKVLFTREPGGTEIAEAIRAVALSKEYDEEMHPIAELLLMCAARAQHVEKKIAPALESGMNVITDRFSLSTYAYQLWGQNRLDLFSQLSQMDAMARGAIHNGHALIGGTKVDLQIVLDIPPRIGLARVSSRKGEINRFDLKDIDFHKRVREGFLTAESQGNTEIVDASQKQEVVQAEVLRIIKKTFAS